MTQHSEDRFRRPGRTLFLLVFVTGTTLLGDVKPRYIAAGILVVIPFIVYLSIPTYDMVSPTLGGIPFFYWWQTLWLALSALLFFGAALLIDWGQPDEVHEPLQEVPK